MRVAIDVTENKIEKSRIQQTQHKRQGQMLCVRFEIRGLIFRKHRVTKLVWINNGGDDSERLFDRRSPLNNYRFVPDGINASNRTNEKLSVRTQPRF